MVFDRQILEDKKVNSKYLSLFIKGSIVSVYLQQIVEDDVKFVQRHETAKVSQKKLIETVV